MDFREKILEAHLNKEGSLPQLSKRFKVSLSTVKRIVHRHRTTGNIELYLYRAGRHELIDLSGKETLKQILKETPDLTLTEIQKKYYEAHQVKPVISVFHRVLKEMKYSYKKKSHFSQQQLRDDVKKKEKNFLKK
jgi:transposase